METKTISANKKPYGAWISPKGEYFEVVEECNHEGIALEITGGLMPKFDDMLPESSYLLASGWMRCVFENKIVSFQAQNINRHQKQWVDLYDDCYIGQAESWAEFTARSEEYYKFSPIYPFGEKSVTFVTFTKRAM